MEKPPDDSIAGVRLITGGAVLCVFILCVRSLCTRRVEYFAATPTVEAICSTRWCDANGGKQHKRRLALFRGLVFAFQMCILVNWAWHTIAQGLTMCGGSGECFLKYSPLLLAHNTNWAYILQTLWWATATTASLSSLASGPGPGARRPSPRLRRFVHATLSLCLPGVVLVCIVEWGVILPAILITFGHAESELNWMSYCMHGINALCLLVEAYVNRMLLHPAALEILFVWCVQSVARLAVQPSPACTHISLLTLIAHFHAFCVCLLVTRLCVYVSNAWAQQATFGSWPYFFLYLNTYAAILWYVLMFGLHLVALFIVVRLDRWKQDRLPWLQEQHFDGAFGASGAWEKRPVTEVDGLIPGASRGGAA
jgi:hypothetical protein